MYDDRYAYGYEHAHRCFGFMHDPAFTFLIGIIVTALVVIAIKGRRNDR